MGMTKLTAAVLALAMTGTAAQAACNQSHINNRTWKLTAFEVTTKAMIFCTFKTSGNGTIAATNNACDVTSPPATDFGSPVKYSIEANSQIVAKQGEKCTFDATINLSSGGTPSILTARLVMESGKTIASGNFIMGESGGGTVSVLRQ